MTATTVIASRRWLRSEASRLDATCYATGGFQARERLAALGLEVRRLDAVADVFAVSLRQRRFVRQPDKGLRFLASSDLPLVDPPADFFLSRARTPQLEDYVVREGWSLISATGTVGNVVYTGPDLAGCAVSQDAIRVRPLTDVQPGYVFAFLSSAVARALISVRTYGTTVDRIHPEHLLDLPVPLAPVEVQEGVNRLITGAATARAHAARALNEVAAHFDRIAGVMRTRHDHSRAVGVVPRRSLGTRLDAFHHVGWAAEPSFVGGDAIGTLAQVISTPRVPRIYVAQGVPFLSGIDVFRVRVTPRVRLARWVAEEFGAFVRAGDLAVQGSGQRYGLLGQVAHIGERLDGWAASHDLFRIRTADPDNSARIFAFLRSDSGHRVMLRHSYGTSIPHVNPAGIAAIRVPKLPADLVSMARLALELREQADRDEERAIEEVETWLA